RRARSFAVDQLSRERQPSTTRQLRCQVDVRVSGTDGGAVGQAGVGDRERHHSTPYETEPVVPGIEGCHRAGETVRPSREFGEQEDATVATSSAGGGALPRADASTIRG